MKIDVRINGMAAPSGFRYDDLICSWKVSDTRAKRQSNVRILVSTDAAFTQVVYTREGSQLSGLGEALAFTPAACTTYYVQVTVAGDNGEQGSGQTSFETAKEAQSWEGEWIGPAAADTFHPELRYCFAASQPVRRARLYICGVGVFEAYVNGEKAGEDYLAPFVNDYPAFLQYMTYDVTGLLDEDNTLTVLLGNGWYKGRIGFTGDKAVFGDRFGVVAELHMEYEDGGKAVIKTGRDWQYRPSFIRDSDIYDGEIQDYQQYAAGKEAWKPVEILTLSDISKGPGVPELTPRYSLPVKVMENLPVREVLRTPAGETVLDFGQNFAGYVEFHAVLPPGVRVVLEMAEVLQDGCFYHDNYRTAVSQFVYLSDGRERLVRPCFTFYGFRYVRVTGWEGALQPEDFTGKVVYSAMERTGYLETSDARLNRLYENSMWGLKSNFLDMPTDCPQRDERLGWTGDAQVFSPTACYHMDTRAFYDKYLRDLWLDQQRHEGAVANYLPNLPGLAGLGGSSSVWGDVATFLPANLYQAYGDKAALKRHYPLMKAWVDYIHREDEKQGTHNLYDFGFHFGDWLAMDGMTEQSVKGGTDDYFIASAYYYASAGMAADAARIIGIPEDEIYYRELAGQIREEILAEYFTPTGRLAIDTQTAYLVALKFGLYPDKERLIKGLKARFRQDGYRIKGGFVGATMMCTVLAENGMGELAYDFLLYEGFPGWLRCVALGATTIWERWNSLLDDGRISGTGMNSLNHYAYGSVMEFAYRYMAGIQPAEPGFAKAVIAPQPDPRLRYLKAVYYSAAGKYVVNWQFETDGRLTFHIEIPFQAAAVLRLPEDPQGERKLDAGVYDFTYRPARDYTVMFTEESRLEQIAENSEGMAILRAELPKIAEQVEAGGREQLAGTIRDLRGLTYMGLSPQKADLVIGKLLQIKRELGSY